MTAARVACFEWAQAATAPISFSKTLATLSGAVAAQTTCLLKAVSPAMPEPVRVFLSSSLAASANVCGACYQPSAVQAGSSIASLRQALDSLSKLQPDWDSYGAVPPSPSVLAVAHDLLDACFEKGVLPSRIVAGAFGGVAFYFLGKSRRADIELYNEGGATRTLKRVEPELLEICEIDATSEVQSEALDSIVDFML